MEHSPQEANDIDWPEYSLSFQLDSECSAARSDQYSVLITPLIETETVAEKGPPLFTLSLSLLFTLLLLVFPAAAAGPPTGELFLR